MEKLLDLGVDILLPHFTSRLFDALEEIHGTQKPPYSDGIYWLTLRNRVLTNKGLGLILYFTPMLYEPLFCRFFRSNSIYINQDGTKFSMRKITSYSIDKKTGEEIHDEYFTYAEGIRHKFPGYTLDESNIVVNVSDKTIDVEEHIALLTSKGPRALQRYEEVKRDLFGG